ncbi:hypothetical protein CEXT_309631 [Caerostris extrusa]|uniref:Uncharacterized protein n=1 Tax=Caerostris extrusa TaxID=172846 RepID=A0AAV4NGI2_CAEEX|nr:hypothetical protein CEXT_309631 [Caerostris extrusa]
MKRPLSLRKTANHTERATIIDGEIHNCPNTKSLRSQHTHRRHPIEMDPNRCVRPPDSVCCPRGLWVRPRTRNRNTSRMMNRFSLGCNRNECKEASSNDVPIPLRGVVLRNGVGRQCCVKWGGVRRIWEAQTCWITHFKEDWTVYTG